MEDWECFKIYSSKNGLNAYRKFNIQISNIKYIYQVRYMIEWIKYFLLLHINVSVTEYEKIKENINYSPSTN